MMIFCPSMDCLLFFHHSPIENIEIGDVEGNRRAKNVLFTFAGRYIPSTVTCWTRARKSPERDKRVSFSRLLPTGFFFSSSSSPSPPDDIFSAARHRYRSPLMEDGKRARRG